MKKVTSPTHLWSSLAVLLSLVLFTSLVASCNQAKQPRIQRVGVLQSGDIRLETFMGLKEGLRKLGYTEGENVIFEVHDAGGEGQRLPELARAMVAGRPDVAVAGGGVEADVLKVATEGSDLPVVFVAMTSPVDRGLVASMSRSGNNLTGIDTNDTQLTAKRLEMITRIAPGARRVLALYVPSLALGVESAKVARETASRLGLQLDLIAVETQEDIKAAAATIKSNRVDAILILPALPVWQAMKGTIYPASLTERVPIMGVDREYLKRGAVATYGAWRYNIGVQAARLVDKVLHGIKPKDIPVETARSLEFVINRSLANCLGLNIPAETWSLTNEIVEMEVNP